MARTSASKKDDPSFDGVTLTNPDRVLFPDIAFTKLDLAHYYETVAPLMLPYVARRPISLVRCPEGYTKECFFQRHAMKGMSDTIKEVAIAGGETKKKYLYIEGEAGLFGMVQIGVLEIHDWGVSLDHIDKPDRIVFDLDPDEDPRVGRLQSRRDRGARLPRRSRLREFSQIDRRQGLAHRRADRAQARLGRSEAVHKSGGRCAGRRASRPLHGQSFEEDARGQDSSSTISAMGAAARPSSTTRPGRKRGRPSPARSAGTSSRA